ncbi:MAG TPA: hypothetical protein VKU82_10085 [Planctomycetaceae bacterium]|nr:hypothetical protein [Planctomycetaceae bacterium]
MALSESTTEPEEAQTATEGVLVMRTGTIVTGKIVRSGSIYEVQGPNGKWAVPEDLVKLRCANLSEAYAKLHESAQAQHDANAHIILARWCLTNHLDIEARHELQDALALEPDREDVKRLLRNAEETIQSKDKPAARQLRADPLRAARKAAAPTGDAVSLGGLSRESALRFTRRIQPLLVNNCTSAGCHGRESKSEFRLYKVTPGKDANRRSAERNLAEVLQQINLHKPRLSPILTNPRGNHGRRGRPVFSGPRGDEQLAELQRWVAEVAGEELEREKRRGLDPRQSGRVIQTSGDDDGGESAHGSKSEPLDGLAASPASSSAFPPVKRPQPPMPPEKGDPFDPAAFNRQSKRRSPR